MSFDYHEPETLAEVTRILAAGPDTAVLAGGTSFTLLWRLGLARPEVVVGLRRLHELRGIRLDERGLWIGALTTHRQVECSPIVREHHSVVADTFATIGTVRIRNQGTIGGNLAHADPAQDPPPTLMALGATVEVAGPDGGRREIPVDALFTGYLETVLAPGDLLLGVRIPLAAAGTRSTYRKFLPRTTDDYCTVSVAASVRLKEGRIADARIALGGVGPTPRRAPHVEAALIGHPPAPEVLRRAAAEVEADVAPIADHRGDIAYKRRMARVWVQRALDEVTAAR